MVGTAAREGMQCITIDDLQSPLVARAVPCLGLGCSGDLRHCRDCHGRQHGGQAGQSSERGVNLSGFFMICFSM